MFSLILGLCVAVVSELHTVFTFRGEQDEQVFTDVITVVVEQTYKAQVGQAESCQKVP